MYRAVLTVSLCCLAWNYAVALKLRSSHGLSLSKASNLNRQPTNIECNTFVSLRTSFPYCPVRSQSTHLKAYDDYDDRGKTALPLKAVIAFIVLGFGVFGSGFLGTVNTALRGLGPPGQQISQPTLKGSQNEEKRGAMTSLTRREINAKLQSLPIFFGTIDEGKSVFTKDGTGIFFTEKGDAVAYFKKEDPSVTVAATSLDDVFYTLIEKKTKLGKFVSGVSALSDPLATYTVRGSLAEYQAASDKYKSTHSQDDVILFRVPNLVFSKEEGLEVPLFLRKEDALTSYTRLQESKAAALARKGGAAASVNPAAAPVSDADAMATFQEVSLLDIISLFKTGGFEGRSLEFYPSVDSIAEARALMGLPSVAESLEAASASSAP